MPSTSEKVRVAGKLFEELKLVSSKRNQIYWRQAEILFSLRKDNLYKFVFGNNEQSWSSFLSEIGMPLSSVDQKIKNWEFYVIKHSFEPHELENIDTSSLYMLYSKKREAPREEVKELIEDSRVLGRGDFIQLLKGHQDCMHESTEEQHIIKCKTCNRKVGSKHHV